MVEINPKMSEYILNFKNHFFLASNNEGNSEVSILVNKDFHENKFNISYEKIEDNDISNEENISKDNHKINKKPNNNKSKNDSKVVRNNKKRKEEEKRKNIDDADEILNSTKKIKKNVKEKKNKVQKIAEKKLIKKAIKPSKAKVNKTKTKKILDVDKKVGWWKK